MEPSDSLRKAKLRKPDNGSHLINQSTNENIVTINEIVEPGLLALTSLCFKSLCVTCVALALIK